MPSPSIPGVLLLPSFPYLILLIHNKHTEHTKSQVLSNYSSIIPYTFREGTSTITHTFREGTNAVSYTFREGITLQIYTFYEGMQ